MAGTPDLSLGRAGFASPFSRGPDLQTLAALSGGFSQAALQLFLECHENILASLGSGVVSSLREWLDTSPSFPEAWTPLFGRAVDLVRARNGEEQAPALAVQILLHLHQAGRSGSWEAKIPHCARFRIGSHVTPDLRFCSCESTDESFHLKGELCRGRAFECEFSSDTLSSASEPLQRLAHLETSLGRILLLTSGGHCHVESPRDFDGVLEEIDKDGTACLSRGLALINQYASVYSRWTELVLREVIPLRQAGDRLRSGGVATHFGQIHMTVSDSRTLVAEMFVHEATHQYFELLRRLDPLEESGESFEFYSPVVGRPRPLWAILKAFHAFANVAMLHSILRQNGISEEELAPVNEGQVASDIQILGDHLAQHAKFTAAGRSLYEDLVEQLANCRH